MHVNDKAASNMVPKISKLLLELIHTKYRIIAKEDNISPIQQKKNSICLKVFIMYSELVMLPDSSIFGFIFKPECHPTAPINCNFNSN
jgi:hypothetical protein